MIKSGSREIMSSHHEGDCKAEAVHSADAKYQHPWRFLGGSTISVLRTRLIMEYALDTEFLVCTYICGVYQQLPYLLSNNPLYQLI